MTFGLKKLRRRLVRFLMRESGMLGRLKRVEQQSRQNARTLSGMRFLLTVAPANAPALMAHVARSKSQHWQDLFVLLQSDFKRNGYFVEFGATDGVKISNTCLLERDYGWTGIVAEPARCWHAALKANRKCHVETKCVWSQSGLRLPFNETREPVLSTLDQYSASDGHARNRKNGTQYEIETISLLDLLQKYDAPRTIDYLSIDTEGSEYEILSHFDFDRYRFRLITCEHNNSPMRQKLFDLLTSKGYERRHETISVCDDWYVDTTR
ncbi:MAG TPA: FkbM family methyltransferase [Lysobacter sp.]|nr:FkbM family methyltransferase [Lysobacter sp.]